MSILDHVSVPVSDYERAKAFYTKALAPLGITIVMDVGPACGFGRRGKPDFWLSQRAAGAAPIAPSHIAFAAESRADVDAFYKEALAAGGKDNGPPGLRAEYHPNYYGAFVLDPDGHNVEAVIHR